MSRCSFTETSLVSLDFLWPFPVHGTALVHAMYIDGGDLCGTRARKEGCCCAAGLHVCNAVDVCMQSLRNSRHKFV